MTGNRSRTEADRRWSRAQHAAHSKNKRELRLLENDISVLSRNQYLAKLRYRQQILDIKESIWPLRANTGYAHSYLDKREKERADERRGACKERFIKIVRDVIKMIGHENGLAPEETEVASKTESDYRERKRDKLITSNGGQAGNEKMQNAGRHTPDIVTSIPDDGSKKNVAGEIQRECDYRTGHRPSDNQNREVLTNKRDLRVDDSVSSDVKIAGFVPSLRSGFEVYDIDFSALSIAQNRANASTTIIGRGPVSLPKCLEYQQCLMDLGSRSFTAALTTKKTRKLNGNNKNEPTNGKHQSNQNSRSGKRSRSSPNQRLSSGVSLSRYVRAVEAGLPTEHLTPGTRDIRIPVSRGLAKRERIKMMKEMRRPRTTSDLEKRRMEFIQAKIDRLKINLRCKVIFSHLC